MHYVACAQTAAQASVLMTAGMPPPSTSALEDIMKSKVVNATGERTVALIFDCRLERRDYARTVIDEHAPSLTADVAVEKAAALVIAGKRETTARGGHSMSPFVRPPLDRIGCRHRLFRGALTGSTPVSP
jgi:hypothetical protein